METRSASGEIESIFPEDKHFTGLIASLKYAGEEFSLEKQAELVKKVMVGEAMIGESSFIRLTPDVVPSDQNVQILIIETVMHVRDKAVTLLQKHHQWENKRKEQNPLTTDLSPLLQNLLRNIATTEESSELMNALDSDALRILLLALSHEDEPEVGTQGLKVLLGHLLSSRLEHSQNINASGSGGIEAANEDFFKQDYSIADLQIDLFGSISTIANSHTYSKQLTKKDHQQLRLHIAGFYHSAHPGLPAILLEYIQKYGDTHGNEIGDICEAAIRTLGTLPTESADEVLMTIFSDLTLSEKFRRMALNALSIRDSALLIQTGTSLLDRMATATQNDAYAIACTFIENDEKLLPQIIQILKTEEKYASYFVDVIAKSNSQIARNALFTIALQHTNEDVVYKAAEAIAEKSLCDGGLHATEEKIVVQVLKAIPHKYIKNALVHALQGCMTEEAIAELIQQKAYMELAFVDPESDIAFLLNKYERQTSKDELTKNNTGLDFIDRLKNESLIPAGDRLLKAEFSTTTYSYPQTWYIHQEELDKETACRLIGMQLLLSELKLCVRDKRKVDTERLNTICANIYEFGIKNMLQGKINKKTRQIGAKILLEILKDWGLSYKEDTMKELRNFSEKGPYA